MAHRLSDAYAYPVSCRSAIIWTIVSGVKSPLFWVLLAVSAALGQIAEGPQASHLAGLLGSLCAVSQLQRADWFCSRMRPLSRFRFEALSVLVAVAALGLASLAVPLVSDGAGSTILRGWLQSACLALLALRLKAPGAASMLLLLGVGWAFPTLLGGLAELSTGGQFLQLSWSSAVGLLLASYLLLPPLAAPESVGS